MKLDHIGIAVSKLEIGRKQWAEQFGYVAMTSEVENTRQKVMVQFLCKEGSLPIKLIAPTSPESPIHGFVVRGGGLHHLCFLSETLSGGIDFLKAHGAKLLVPPQPGEAFENENIAFLLVGNGLNVELVDTIKRANRIA